MVAYSLQTGMTSPDYEWEECVYECACLLKKKGAVIVQFWSPDHPDDYQGYVYTTANGGVDTGSRCSLYSYKRALGADDIKLVYEELLSGRTQRERDIAAERKQRKEALRKAKGDFEIIGGVLKKYRGTETDETIPDGVIEIGEFAFVDKHSWERMLLEDEEYDAPVLETLIIPSGVQKIGTYAYPVINGVQPEPDPEWMQILEIMSKPGRAMESSYCPRLYKGINYKVDYSGLIAIGVGIEKERIGRDRYRQVYELRFENGDLCNFIDITEAWKKQDEIEGEQRGYWWLKEENDYWFLLNYKSMGIP